jgi:membrane-anchored glycerophosphoryl diester phosphodiesterase (GDPDase)
MFVVPVMIFEEKGVFASMKESLTLFKKTWGESVVGNISIGVVFGAAGIVCFLLVVAAFFTGNFAAVLIAIALFIVLIAALVIVSSAMNGIFIVVLYTYAKTGAVPSVYPGDLIRSAFIQKQPS